MVKTRKSLWAAGFALLVCILLLIGTTFAWFTDSVSNSGNKIQAGSLEVSFAEFDPAEDGYVNVGKEPIFNYDKWEPGYTDVACVKIGNEGTLALKYQLDIIVDGDVGNLADVIDVYYVADSTARTALPADTTGMKYIGTLSQVLNNASENGVAHGNLLAGEADFATIALHMQETAGNEYQGASIGTAFDIVLNATQLTHETDGFESNQYDNGASLPDVINSSDYGSLQDAVNEADGDTVVVKGNQSPSSALNLSKDVTLNLGSSIIAGKNNNGNGINISGDNKNITIQATTGGVQMDNQRCIAVSAKDSNIVVDGGNYSLEGITNAYFMEDRSGGSNTVTIQNATYNGDRGVQFSNSNGNNILIRDTILNCTGYSTIFIGGNNNVCTLENVTVNGSQIFAADSSHVGADGYSVINIKSGTYNCRLTTSDNCIISVSGGSFKYDPAEYLADGYKATKDTTTGMWVVTAE